MIKITKKNLSNKELVLEILKLVPKGKIVSFGQIGNLINLHPRIVGFILSGMKKSEMALYPWHRVVDRNGFISSSKLGEKGILQKRLLEMEGLKINGFQIINPEKYWWKR